MAIYRTVTQAVQRTITPEWQLDLKVLMGSDGYICFRAQEAVSLRQDQVMALRRVRWAQGEVLLAAALCLAGHCNRGLSTR